MNGTPTPGPPRAQAEAEAQQTVADERDPGCDAVARQSSFLTAVRPAALEPWSRRPRVRPTGGAACAAAGCVAGTRSPVGPASWSDLRRWRGVREGACCCRAPRELHRTAALGPLRPVPAGGSSARPRARCRTRCRDDHGGAAGGQPDRVRQRGCRDVADRRAAGADPRPAPRRRRCAALADHVTRVRHDGSGRRCGWRAASSTSPTTCTTRRPPAVSRLRYCDAHTVGLLDRTARALSGKRRLVVLYQPRIMRRLLSVAGVADRDRAARSVLIARYAAGEVGRCVRAWWERIGP